jgi:hypothetical protein
MRTALALITALCAASGLAACGGSGASGGTETTAKAGFGQALKFSRCMRANGVPNFPDPSAAGGGIRLEVVPGSGIKPQTPAFQAAQKKCRRLLPGGGPGALKATHADFVAALAFAKCMRSHGLPNFPDPLASAPAGSGPIISLHGMLFRPGQGLDPMSPAFRQAASHCGVSLPRPPGSG